MSRITAVLLITLAIVVLVGTAGLVAGHSWQTTVTQGDMELGVNTNPVSPVAGLETEVSGSITDTDSDGEAPNRTEWGGVVDKEIEVHINGPNDIHDHTEVEIPEDDSHFHFAYQFPDEGLYTLTFETTIDGEEYAFEVEREVTLMPSEASGDEIASLQDDIDELQDSIEELPKDNVLGLSPTTLGLGILVLVTGGMAGLVVGRRD